MYFCSSRSIKRFLPGTLLMIPPQDNSTDKICIFGFSRGAYIARALAGMINKVGLLPVGNLQQVPFAYQMYTDVSSDGWKQSNAFKGTFSLDVVIDFVGVW